jgi:hypothetical protein
MSFGSVTTIHKSERALSTFLASTPPSPEFAAIRRPTNLNARKQLSACSKSIFATWSPRACQNEIGQQKNYFRDRGDQSCTSNTLGWNSISIYSTRFKSIHKFAHRHQKRRESSFGRLIWIVQILFFYARLWVQRKQVNVTSFDLIQLWTYLRISLLKSVLPHHVFTCPYGHLDVFIQKMTH